MRCDAQGNATIVNEMKTPGHGVLLCYFVAIVRVCLAEAEPEPG